MTETTNPVAPPPAAPAEPPKTFWQKYQRWIWGIIGVIFLINGALQLYRAFSPALPGCTTDATATVLKDIFKQRNVELTQLSDMQTLTDTASEKTCQAHAETPTETATLFYRIFWEDKEAKVLITKVDAKPR